MLSVRLLGVLAFACLSVAAVLQFGLANGHRGQVGSRVASHAYREESLLRLPAAAQGAVSAALGESNSAYRVSPVTGGWRAVSPAQHLTSSFSRSDVSVRSGRGVLDLSLRGVGYGASRRPVAAVVPSLSGNRVVYGYRGVSEWYEIGPLGLEQGYTIPHAPARRSAGWLTLAIAIGGNLRASLAQGGQSLTLGRGGHSLLRYGDLVATDGNGHTLRSSLGLDGNRILICVDARGARYPLTIDPLVQQGSALTDSSSGGYFGQNVALSSDGSTLLVGAPNANSSVGAALVFTKSGGAWTRQTTLVDSTADAGSSFGVSVALSSDGNTALIGGDNDAPSADGAAWVFTRSGSTWTQQAKLTDSTNAATAAFGKSVALSSDGTVALIGSPQNSLDTGTAAIFTLASSVWTQQAQLTDTPKDSNSNFGDTVALNSAGTTALIGGYTDSSSKGAAWVFTGSGSSWSQQAKLVDSGADANADFGWSLALDSAGTTALIGGFADNSSIGAAWVFTGSGSSWSQQAKLVDSGNDAGADFGSGVALSSDGTTALIGGPGANGSVGAAWVFTGSGSSWTQQSQIVDSGGDAAASFGYAVALDGSADTAAVGGDEDNSGAGAAWVFGSGTSSTGLASAIQVNCDDENTGLANEYFQCTAQIADASGEAIPQTPTGTVTFAITSGGGGAFQGSNVCTLAPSQSGPTSYCSVNYVPSAPGAIPVGSQPPITASYSGDTTFAPTAGAPQGGTATCSSGDVTDCVTTTDTTTTDTTITLTPPLTPQQAFQLFCVQNYSDFCAGSVPPPPSLNDQCVSLEGCAGGAGSDQGGSGESVTISPDQGSLVADATCPVTSGPLTDCEWNTYLTSTNPDPALVAKIQYYQNYDTFKAQVAVDRGTTLTAAQGFLDEVTQYAQSQDPPDTATLKAVTAARSTISEALNQAFDAITPAGTPGRVIFNTLDFVQGLCSDGLPTPESCATAIFPIFSPINDAFRTIALTKANLGVWTPWKAPQSGASQNALPKLATPSRANAARSTHRLKEIVLVSSGKVTLAEGAKKKIRLTIPSVVRQELRFAFAKGVRKLKATLVVNLMTSSGQRMQRTIPITIHLAKTKKKRH
jgi:hypothetical protein